MFTRLPAYKLYWYKYKISHCDVLTKNNSTNEQAHGYPDKRENSLKKTGQRIRYE